ncbi:glycoside hydrolase family 125 protein [Thermus thermamylovorans]|uniref:Metal-independent alpha-mannosidase n=1 Tax=Thermus thermamylovorans TaxID=2509362 RepID=A0A4Q9B9Y4_9DEIN|nr:glycoside hydrolase family 125 protein [Thermus thermamylovorans]TBH21833.1 metal-independent alpha-mannosidase [Thermus thermamylovorans]
MREALLTPAPVLEAPPRHRPTGSLLLHLEADPDRPLLRRAGVVRLAWDGLLDLVGDPLLGVEGEGWEGGILADWIPFWRGEGREAVLLAPPGVTGFALRVRGPGPLRVFGGPFGLLLRRFREEGVEARPRFAHDPWTGSHLLELRAHRTLLALAWQGEPAPLVRGWGPGLELEWPGGEATLYLALAREGDGARTAALHLRRVGWEGLLGATLRHLEGLVAGYGGPLPGVYRRHLLFAYHFAQGEALEGEPVALTSRSPHYYVSGAYWARDGLLWFFPALLLADRRRARTLLKALFLRHAPWPGEHAQYLSGPPLYPGFELDEAAAYPLALARYLEATGDLDLLPEVWEPLEGVLARIREERHPALPLYRTFLSPADDPVPYPYLFYGNALLAQALARLAPHLARLGGRWAGWAAELAGEAQAIREALRREGVRPRGRGGVFPFAFEPGGGALLGDEPAGSLLLLPHLGFCPPEDPWFRRTVRRILSPENPYHYRGRYPGEGSPHFPFPSGFALANRLLLGGRPAREALRVLREAPLDMGYAPESFDPDTGLARTGVGFASLAGFVAYALSTATPTAWARASGRR